MQRGEQGSVLVVDDEIAVRDSLHEWFRKDGHRVGIRGIDALGAIHGAQPYPLDQAATWAGCEACSARATSSSRISV